MYRIHRGRQRAHTLRVKCSELHLFVVIFTRYSMPSTMASTDTRKHTHTHTVRRTSRNNFWFLFFTCSTTKNYARRRQGNTVREISSEFLTRAKKKKPHRMFHGDRVCLCESSVESLCAHTVPRGARRFVDGQRSQGEDCWTNAEIVFVLFGVFFCLFTFTHVVRCHAAQTNCSILQIIKYKFDTMFSMPIC